MNEAQERNLVRFVIANSVRFDDVFEEYLGSCREDRVAEPSKEDFAIGIQNVGFRIIAIEGTNYVFGALRKGETRQKTSFYVKNTPPIDKEEWDRWLAEHAWKPS